MTRKAVTYGQLHRMLLGLCFEDVPTQRTWRAFRHAPSGTLILLANRRPDLPARRPDVVSIRRHLAENGILEEAEFDRYVASVA